MNKREKLLRQAGANIDESLAAPVRAPNTAHAPLQQGNPLERPDDAAVWISTDRIVPDPDQPRKHFDEDKLRLLSESLKEAQHHGVVVYWDADSQKYVIVSGERRWRAAKLVGILELRCTLLPHKPPEADRLQWQLIENEQRCDLDIIEFGEGCRRLMRLRGWNATELTNNLHLDRTRVCKALAIEEFSSPELKQAVKANVVTQRDAYQSTQIKDEEERREMEQKLIKGEATEADVRAAAAKNPRSNAGRATAKKKSTRKKPFAATVTVGDLRVTVACKRSTKSPGDTALADAAQAAAEIFRKRQSSPA